MQLVVVGGVCSEGVCRGNCVVVLFVTRFFQERVGSDFGESGSICVRWGWFVVGVSVCMEKNGLSAGCSWRGGVVKLIVRSGGNWILWP